MEKIVVFCDRDGFVKTELANVGFEPRPSWQWWALYAVPSVEPEDVSAHPGRADWSRWRRREKIDWSSAVKLSSGRKESINV